MKIKIQRTIFVSVLVIVLFDLSMETNPRKKGSGESEELELTTFSSNGLPRVKVEKCLESLENIIRILESRIPNNDNYDFLMEFFNKNLKEMNSSIDICRLDEHQEAYFDKDSVIKHNIDQFASLTLIKCLVNTKDSFSSFHRNSKVKDFLNLETSSSIKTVYQHFRNILEHDFSKKQKNIYQVI